MIGLAEAVASILGFSRDFGEEIVPIEQAFMRVLARDVAADRAYPPFHRASMDGYAICFDDFTKIGLREFNVILEIHAGDSVQIDAPNQGECVKIMTGAATPECFDAIIRVEDARVVSNGRVKFEVVEVRKGQNIAKMGEDSAEKELVLPKGSLIRATELGVLATVGMNTVSVQKMPRVALFSTGNELKSVDAAVLPFQIRDSNKHALEGFLKNYQCQPYKSGLLPDDKDVIRQGLESAEDADIIILTGGVSAGDADYVPFLLKEAGYEEIFHKVKIKPGKPFWFGVKGKQVVFALPGNPMSCQVGFKLFIEPFLRKSLGLVPYSIFQFPLSQERKKKVNLDEFFPAKIVDSHIFEIKMNGSGDIRTGLGSDGIACHAIDSSDLKAGDKVGFMFW